MNNGKQISFVQKALSGMLSGSIAVCIGTPFDIALVRLQADGMAKPEDRRNYKNVFDVSVVEAALVLCFWASVEDEFVVSLTLFLVCGRTPTRLV